MQSNIDNPFPLDHGERNSSAWAKVKQFADYRIEKLRVGLETCPPEKVVDLQAEIRALRWIIKEGEPKQFVDKSKQYREY